MRIFRSLTNTEFFTLDEWGVKDRFPVRKGSLPVELSVWFDRKGSYYLLPNGAVAIYRSGETLVGVREVEEVKCT